METFTTPLSYGSSVDWTESTRIAEFGDGYAQRAPDGINSKRMVVSLRFDSVRDGRAAEVVEFLKARGATEPFLFTPPAPHDEEYTFVLRTPLRHGFQAFDSNALEVTFVQDFSGPARVAAPVLDFTGGDLTITCATAGATIYWTFAPLAAGTYPSRPLSTDTAYAAPIVGATPGYWRARAVKAGMLRSFTAEALYTP